MKVKHIDCVNELPHNTPMVLYNAPYFSVQQEDGESDEDFSIRDSAYLFRQKYGEPEMMYLHEANVFIELGE